MDDHHFDRLVRSFGSGSRRTVLRASLATLVSSLGLTARAATAPAACRDPGSRCSKSAQCCSGRCRKKGRKRRKTCAPLPANAHGCTVEDVSCPDGQGGTECPDLPNGRCRITLRGRPVCAVRSTNQCEACKDNQDCVDGVGGLEGLGVGAICIRCEGCQSGTTCICPFFVNGGEE